MRKVSIGGGNTFKICGCPLHSIHRTSVNSSLCLLAKKINNKWKKYAEKGRKYGDKRKIGEANGQMDERKRCAFLC